MDLVLILLRVTMRLMLSMAMLNICVTVYRMHVLGFTGTPVELTDKNTRAVFGDYTMSMT